MAANLKSAIVITWMVWMIGPIGLGHSVLVAQDDTALEAKESSDRQDQSDQQQVLKELQLLIGQWRGVGQPQRGSSAGAWRESKNWIWEFGDGDVALTFQAEDGKYFQGGTVESGSEDRSFEAELVSAQVDQPVRYAGILDDDGRLILERVAQGDEKSQADSESSLSMPDRITFRFAADGKRLIVLYQRRASEDTFYRIAEVGYTRQGSDFGKGSSYSECIVTGGRGTIPVTHDGETYYVCCSGCKAAFEDDPETILEEYRQRLADQQNDKNL